MSKEHHKKEQLKECSLKEHHQFKTEIIFNIYVFTDTPEQFNASLMNKINFLKNNNKKNILSPNFWYVSEDCLSLLYSMIRVNLIT